MWYGMVWYVMACFDQQQTHIWDVCDMNAYLSQEYEHLDVGVIVVALQVVNEPRPWVPAHALGGDQSAQCVRDTFVGEAP